MLLSPSLSASERPGAAVRVRVRRKIPWKGAFPSIAQVVVESPSFVRRSVCSVWKLSG